MSDARYAHGPDESRPFEISRFSADNSGSCVAFRKLENGNFEIEDDKISEADRHLTRQTYDRAEMAAFLKAGAAGDVVDWTEEELRDLALLVEAAMATRTEGATTAQN